MSLLSAWSISLDSTFKEIFLIWIFLWKIWFFFKLCILLRNCEFYQHLIHFGSRAARIWMDFSRFRIRPYHQQCRLPPSCVLRQMSWQNRNKWRKENTPYFSTHNTSIKANSNWYYISTFLFFLLLRDHRQSRRHLKGKRREKNLVVRARPFQQLNLVLMLVASLTLVFSSDDNITICQHKIPVQSEGMVGGGGGIIVDL